MSGQVTILSGEVTLARALVRDKWPGIFFYMFHVLVCLQTCYFISNNLIILAMFTGINCHQNCNRSNLRSLHCDFDYTCIHIELELISSLLL